MGYSADGNLATDLFPGQEFIQDVGAAITDAVIDRWRGGVAFRTPVARLPQAYKGHFEDWIADRGGRTPRTMRDSWRRTMVFRTDEGHTADVFSDEPVNARGQQLVDYVEEDTRPHIIQANRASGSTGEPARSKATGAPCASPSAPSSSTASRSCTRAPRAST